jgi:hypothetical protein
MGLCAATAGCALVLIAGVLTADAAPRKHRAVAPVAGAGSTVFTSRDEDGRTRTRIIVQKRSYLDGGTEVMPGDISRNYMALPTQSASGMLGPNEITNPPGPIPDPFFLPGKNNPWLGFQY